MEIESGRRRVWAVALAMLALCGFVIALDAGGIATRLRDVLFDNYQRAAPRSYQAHDANGASVRVLAIDKASTDRFGPWPWPRSVLARLIGELKDAGASVIVIAMPLDEADPAAPSRLIADLPAGPDADAAREALAKLPSPDDALASSMMGGKVAVGFALGIDGRMAALKHDVETSGDANAFTQIPDYRRASAPLAPFESAAGGLGVLNLAPDADGNVRRAQLVYRLNGAFVAQLVMEALRLSRGAQTVVVRADEPGHTLFAGAGVNAIDAGDVQVPTEPDGSTWIYYSGDMAQRNVSAAALDSGSVDANALRNTIIIIGAPNDMVQTALGPRTAAAVQAETLENVLGSVHLLRPSSALIAELIFLGVVGIAIVLLFARGMLLVPGVLTVVAVVGAGALSWWLFTTNHVLLDALSPSVSLALVFGVGALAGSFEVGRARARLRSAFSEALPAEAVNQIARRPALMKLEGQARTVSYLACGIRGFASVAESFRDDPAGLTNLMARVLTPLIDVALAKRATLDRMNTDGFTCFWNAPLDDPEHAIHACEAASRMVEVVAEVNDALSRERRFDGMALQPVEIGIGISTGTAIAGGFGAHGRSVYSVTGDCTLLADRIQALSQQYGPAIIVSEDTRKGAERGFAFLEVDYIAAGSRDEPVKLYAVLGNPLVRASPKFRALATFHEHIFQSLRTQQWEKTRGLIDQCRKLSGASQKLYDLHLARIAYFEDNPPGPDWDGAFRPILN